MTNVQPTDDPRVPVPREVETCGEWDEVSRFVWTEDRPVESANLVVFLCASQLHDGSIDHRGKFTEPPTLVIQSVSDDWRTDILTISTRAIPELVQALTETTPSLPGANSDG
jgi:hypothetical protein